MAAKNRPQNGTLIPPVDIPDYAQWSNADLVQRVTSLEAQLRAQCIHHSKSPSPNRSPPPGNKKPKKASKPFDPSKYSTRHIALKFAYLGGQYNGFEHHANNNTPLPTVEEELWKAFRKTKLIFPSFKDGQSENEVCWDGCDYSKCGRTDRGVSAFGQVIGLSVRSNRRKEKDNKTSVEENDGLSPRDVDVGEDNSTSDIATSHEGNQETPKPVWDSIKDELPYIQLLNRVLPPDIRILAWCPNPPADFSARFNCKERRYRYFFTNPACIPDPESSATATGGAWLDIDAMQQAAKNLEGLHDFRNFCKVDPTKQITNFERRIFHASIKRVGSDMQPGAFLQGPPFASTQPLQMYYFEVRGSAFLWHQVRHLIAVLFLVGQGYESPTVVDELLDVQRCPAKPVYEMADDLPLVLWDCIFPDSKDIAVGDGEGSGNVNEYEDALEWIYVGDNSSGGANRERRSVTDGMQDRKFGRLSVMEDLWTQWHRRKIDEVLAGSLMDVVARQGKSRPVLPEAHSAPSNETSARVFDGSGTPRNVGKYVPLMQRQRMAKPEVLNARYAVRKGLNGSQSVDGQADMDE